MPIRKQYLDKPREGAPATEDARISTTLRMTLQGTNLIESALSVTEGRLVSTAGVGRHAPLLVDSGSAAAGKQFPAHPWLQGDVEARDGAGQRNACDLFQSK